MLKTILMHVDGSEHSRERARIAAVLAERHEAHVVGAAMSGMSRYAMHEMRSATGPEFVSASPAIEEHARRLRQESQAELDAFEQQMRSLGVASFERRLIDDELIGGLSLQARYADLTVLTQYDPGQLAGAIAAELPEIVAMSSGRPVLVLPHAWTGQCRFSKAVLAWDASVEATRALHFALPLLKAADRVQVAVFNAASAPDLHGEEPGADIALYLARHGVEVNVAQEAAGTVDVGNALISRCADWEADFMVAGCYGHTRFREILLGGVSRTLLASSTIPVLMAH